MHLFAQSASPRMLFTPEHFWSMMYPVTSAAKAVAERPAARPMSANVFFIIPPRKNSLLGQLYSCCGSLCKGAAYVFTRTVSATLIGWITALMHNRAEILRQRAIWKQQGRRVVFTNGCYDLLHPGHIRLLEEAKSEGDILIVGLNTDASVARSKGAGRPVTNQCERAEMLLALAAVDAVVLFDEDTPRQLIAELLPDVLIKGADWTHFIAGKEEVEAAGGRVLTIALEPGHSTTAIIKKILSSQF